MAGAALSVGVFYGCQKNQAIEELSTSTVSNSVEDKLLIDEAKTYFESRLVELKKQKEATANKLKVRDNQTTDATFDGLDVIPKWDKSKVIRQNGSSFVETPYEFEGGKQFGLSTSKNSNIAPDEKSASRLIVKKNRSGVQSANFMSVSADDEYLNGNNTSLKNFTYEYVPNKFKGNEMHFNIDGSFKNGWHFADGKVNGIVKKIKAGSLGTRDACEYNVCIWTWKSWAIYGGNKYLINTEYDCNNYSVRLLICNGWISPAEMNNNSNTNEWGGDDSPIGLVQNNDITHPCYEGIIERLMRGGVYSDLNIYLKNFTNSTFTLRFHDNYDIFSSVYVTARSSFDPRTGYADIYLNHESLANASTEFIASTIIHEILHVYFQADLKDFSGTLPHHRRMAEEYAECLENILSAYYPQLNHDTVEALTWKGLYQTVPYNDKPEDVIKRMKGLVENHHNLNNTKGGIYGNPCH